MRKTVRMVILIIAVLLLAFGFRLFDIFEDSILTTHNVHWKIKMKGEIFIDFYGAIIPTVFSLFIVFYIVYFRKFSFRSYVSYFLMAIFFGFLTSRASSGAIVTFYRLLALLVSSLAVFITFYEWGLVKFLKLRDCDKLDFTKRGYINALLIAYTYASMSVLIVDLAYILTSLPFGVLSFYIGAMGLTDGIMLSGLITPLCVTLVTLLTMFYHEIHTQTHNN